MNHGNHHRGPARISRREMLRRSSAGFGSLALAGLLGESDIGYLSMGEELGGYRKGGYRAYTGTAEFQAGLDRLEAIAGERTAAILCAERLPWRCHRRFIARELEGRGWQVRHIIEEGR